MAYISDKKWNKIVDQVYRRWYGLAVPKNDYDELYASAYEICEDNNHRPGTNPHHMRKLIFEAYFINREDFEKVFDDVVKGFKLTRAQKHDLHWLALGYGPMVMPLFIDDESKEKFNRLIEKVDNQELITPEDLFDAMQDDDKFSIRNVQRLYEYNRRSHPEEAAKYFEMLKVM